MPAQNAARKQKAWQVIRHFEGVRDPEAVLRALIQAHRH